MPPSADNPLPQKSLPSCIGPTKWHTIVLLTVSRGAGGDHYLQDPEEDNPWLAQRKKVPGTRHGSRPDVA